MHRHRTKQQYVGGGRGEWSVWAEAVKGVGEGTRGKRKLMYDFVIRNVW